jgi:hypothetical protein
MRPSASFALFSKRKKRKVWNSNCGVEQRYASQNYNCVEHRTKWVGGPPEWCEKRYGRSGHPAALWCGTKWKAFLTKWSERSGGWKEHRLRADLIYLFVLAKRAGEKVDYTIMNSSSIHIFI